jgi:hypothetical protein
MEFEQFLRPIAGAASAAMAGATGQGSPSPQAGTPK